jgi:hypothetical protein
MAKCMQITGDGRPMKHIPSFARSHWMPSLGECLRLIAPAADMVDDIGGKHKH